jgi:hypothetical protein
MGTQRIFPTITNVAKMTNDTPFHNGTVQQGRFQTCPSSTTAELLYHSKKELINSEANKGYHTKKTKNSVFTERTQESHKQLGQYSRKKNNSEDKILSITNDFKRYNIADLTRPNELSTTTNKVATRSPERI